MNRLWTFRHHRGHFGYQGLRFFVVSAIVYVCNLAILTVLVELGLGKIVSQAIAIVLVTPANFVGNKLWSFRRRHDAGVIALARAPRPLVAAMFASSAGAADRSARLTKDRATANFLAKTSGDRRSSRATRRGAHWLDATRRLGERTDAQTGAGRDVWRCRTTTARPARSRRARSTTRPVRVTEAWTGPQVAWTMARCNDGAFGGEKINSLPVGSAFCAALPARARRLPAAALLRNLDLLALLVVLRLALVLQPRRHLHAAFRSSTRRSSTCSAALLWIGVAAGRRAARCAGLAGLAPRRRAVFLVGFRIGLNVRDVERDRRRLRGRHRRGADLERRAPYGHFPIEDACKACGPADTERRDPGPDPDERALRVRQPPAATRTGPSPTRPTCPGYWIFGWSGQVGQPARRALHVDPLRPALPLGLALVGRRFGGRRLGGDARVRLGRVPVHAVRLELEHERRDHARVPDLGLLARAARRSARGAFAALAGLDEVRGAARRAALADLSRRRWRRPGAAAELHRAGSRSRPLAAFSVLLLEPPAPRGAHLLGPDAELQITRESPFSLWDWAQYHAARHPGPALVQRVLQGLLVARRRCRRLRPAHEGAAAARGADGRAPDRLRARPDALVLPLHPVVLPLRRVCCAAQQWPRARRAQHLVTVR